MKERKTNVILGCLLLMLLTSLPLLTDFLMLGTDLQYQLVRIEALKNGLQQIGLHLWAKPVWINPLGYSFAMFYGDTFLYIPALLRLIGADVQTSYRLFNILINVVTVLLSYYAFRRIFQNEYTGLLGAGLYSVSIYRLFLMYSEADLGAVTALAFLPLVLYGCYLLWFTADQGKDAARAFLFLALGMSGMFRSHILTFLIVTLFLLILLLCSFRCWKKGSMWAQLGLTIVSFLLLNSAYLYSMLQYIRSGAVVNPVSGQAIQTNGIQIAQLFMFFYQAGASHDFGTNGVNNAVPVGLGFTLLLAVLVYGYLLFVYGQDFTQETKRAGRRMFWLGFAGCLLSCICFPWDYLLQRNGMMASLVSMIQKPWYFLAVPLLLFSVLGTLTYEMFRKKFPQYYRIYGVSLFVLTCISGSYLGANMLYTYNFGRIKLATDIAYDGLAQTDLNAVPATAVWMLLQAVSLLAFAAAIVLLFRKTGKREK